MVRVSVTELKNNLSQYLRLVKQGETVEVLERSVPIARLEGLGKEPGREGDTLRRLARDGVVRLAARPPVETVLAKPPVPCAADPARVLVEERGER